MALRYVLTDEDALLRKHSRDVKEITPRIRELVGDMWDTMYNSNGVGLAAPQVGVLRRVVVIDTTPPPEDAPKDAPNTDTTAPESAPEDAPNTDTIVPESAPENVPEDAPNTDTTAPEDAPKDAPNTDTIVPESAPEDAPKDAPNTDTPASAPALAPAPEDAPDTDTPAPAPAPAPALALAPEDAEPADTPAPQKYVLINPQLLYASEETVKEKEGCLSVPGVVGVVERPVRVRVRAQNEDGEFFEVEADGMLAKALCHEIDHLEGILFTDLATEIEEASASDDTAKE